jgi:DNA-directed RNA polymerase specialized sigma subunit, sigma24 homolog
VRLWKALQNGEKIEAAPASYIYRTAASAALDLLRRRRARRETPVRVSRVTGEAILGEAPSPEALMDGAELAEQIGEAVGRLADSRRSVVRMYLAGYGREEIADLWAGPRPRPGTCSTGAWRTCGNGSPAWESAPRWTHEGGAHAGKL